MADSLIHPQSEDQRDLIVLQMTGQLFFIGLFALSMFYWKERQAFDAAHYLVEIINSKFFFIAHHRPLGLVSQVLVVPGVWLHLPLKIIAILYSVGDILWYYFIFLWLAYGLKNAEGLISLLMVLSLTIRYSFFCPVTELLQGLALLPVWTGLLNRTFPFKLHVLIVMLALLLFSHPLLFYPVAFALLVWQIDNNMSGRLLKILWISFAFILLIKLVVLDAYDHDKTFYPIVYNDYGYLKTMSFAVYAGLLKVFAQNYTILCVLFFATLALLFSKGRFKHGLMLLLAVALYLLLIIATHRFSAISNYSERMLLPVPAMIALSAAGSLKLYTSFILKLSAYIILLMILIIHFDFIRITAKPYTMRIKQMESLLSASKQMGIRKGIVSEVLMEQTSFSMTGWSYSMETMWLSALNGPGACISIAMQRDHINRIREQGNTVKEDQWIQWAERIRPLSSLNTVYFNLPVGPYRTLYENGGSSALNTSLHFAGFTKIDRQKAVLAFTVQVPDGKTFYSSDSSCLQLHLPGGPPLRLQPPFHLKGKNTLWMEVPVHFIPDAGMIHAGLLDGRYETSHCELIVQKGRLKEGRYTGLDSGD